MKFIIPYAILLIILVVFYFMSRKNYKNKNITLISNLEQSITEFRITFNNLSIEDQTKFLSTLDDKSMMRAKLISENRLNYTQNAWVLQKQLIEQQELIGAFSNFNKKLL